MKFKEFLFEQKEVHAVMSFGRMNPITVGHEKLINKVKEVADKVGGTSHVVLSHSQDSKKNPLSPAQKVRHAKRAFPGVNFSSSSKESPNFLTQAADLHKKGVTHLHVVGGSDRVSEFKNTLKRYNGTHEGALFNFKHIKVHSAGQRDPDAEGVEGMSASKMREHAQKGNFKEFRKGAPSKMTDTHAKELYNDVRRGMGLHEDINLDFVEVLLEGVNDQSIFKAVFLAGGPGSGKDYVLDNTLQGHGLTEINSDKALEFLMDKEGLDKKMPESEKELRDFVRNKAKTMTELRQRLALKGRNGLIINGTGDDPQKIERIKKGLEKLGYESSMVLVNTADDVSAQRNIERGQRGGRAVPETIRKEKWDNVQNARTEYAKMFGSNYIEFDNSEDLREAPPEVVRQKKMEMTQIFKQVKEFTAKPPENDEAQNWVAQEMQKADTLPVKVKSNETMPHSESAAAQEARSMGLQYYGFGRYGKNGKVTHRSVHDKLVAVKDFVPEQPKIPVSGSSTQKEDVNKEFEMLSESVTFTVTGETASEVQEFLSNMNFDSIEQNNEEYEEPSSKLLSLGKVRQTFGEKMENTTITNEMVDSIFEDKKEQKQENLLKDGKGKVRVFMLRAGAAREAHQRNGVVMKHDNGYVIKLKEENLNDNISKKYIRNWTEEIRESVNGTASFGTSNSNSGNCGGESNTGRTGETKILTEETVLQQEKYNTGESKQKTSSKNSFTEIRKRQNEKTTTINDSIDYGTEPGLSMAGAGESIGRDMGEKIKKKTGKVSVTELTGDETTASISSQKEDELKKVGINLKTFKSKRPI